MALIANSLIHKETVLQDNNLKPKAELQNVVFSPVTGYY
jgi:hypothetical protein